MTRRDRRAVFVGGVTVLAAVLALRVAPSCVRAIEELKTRAVERTATLERARATVLSTPSISDSLAAALDRLVLVAPKLAGNGTAARAGATLSGAMTVAAQRSRLRMLESRPLDDSVGTVFGTVRLFAELEGDIAGLSAFLAELESSETILSVDRLVIRNASHTRDARVAEVLRIEVEVRGLFLVEDGA